jgi:hypothetical protein
MGGGGGSIREKKLLQAAFALITEGNKPRLKLAELFKKFFINLFFTYLLVYISLISLISFEYFITFLII